MANSYDLIFLGGGPGGYVAAIRAAQLGLNTAVVEREHLGGICLNWGCIPTKALLRSSELYHLMGRAEEFGIDVKEININLKKMVERSRAVAGQLSKGVGFLFKKNKIAHIAGTGHLAGKGKLEVELNDGGTETLSARNIIIATGARARELPEIKADGKTVWTYKQAMVPEELPRRLLVIGSGAIGIEFASFYADLGSDVTVVEILDRILPVEDEEVSRLAEKTFKKQGIKIYTSTSASNFKATGDGVKATLKSKKGGESQAEFDKVILAVGITGNVENIGLEEAGVTVDRGHITVDEWGATGVEGLWAIGDVTGPPWLAHKAMHEGVATVEKIAGHKGAHPLDKANIPGCTYSRPQVASVGMTEAAAKEAGFDVKVGRFPFIGNGKAIALGEPEGLVKTVFDAKTGELLGAHMIGAEVTELIQGFAIARTLETTEEELIRTVFPHPTLSEMMHESVLAAFGRELHI